MGDFLKKAYDDAEQNQKPAKADSFHIWPIVLGTIAGNILGATIYYFLLLPILF